ncbi:MAG TPA: NADH-quinone oxidoreductase subunit I [Phycisphaerae bacterium]|nr:NADH-quinone oxidoreductase subunit I [Phycisphaerae bacterium]HRY67437.1 NADH-quinone oxidoreductase subunit I [Phycisphaerae bacterium]HSA28972.1 NADH-quinone oxidoreductase subunit I [Phycisphaerae bacterium]
MIKLIREIVGGLYSLLVGMRITIGQFFKPTVTVHYPHEALKMPPRFRGHIELVLDPETGKPRCYACKVCEKSCPSDCITVDGVKFEGAKRKSVTIYKLDFTRCSLCGSCVEACRDGAIRFSHDYNMAGLSKEEFVIDLFKKLEDETRAAGGMPFLPPVAAGPAEPAGGGALPGAGGAAQRSRAEGAAVEPNQTEVK